MKRLRKVKQAFGRHEDESSWPNPRASIGNPVGTSPDGKCTYWIAKGPAGDTWKGLGRNIKNCIENGACEYGSAFLTVEMYMFGSTEDTAAPKILICSEDKKARDQGFKAIEKSEIMNQHPFIGLEQISKLTKLTPKRLSQDEIEFNFIFNSIIGNETVVLTAPLDKPFGRRLFIPKQDSSSLRAATAGPILHVNGKVYQLTVGHAFLESGDFALSQAGSEDSEHRDIQGQNETHDGNSDIQLSSVGESNSERASTGNAAGNRLQGPSSSYAQCSSIVGTSRQPSLDSGVGLARDDMSTTNDRMVPRKLDPLGKLAWLSDTSSSNAPDYALVELEEAYSKGSNQVPCGPNGSQRFLHVWQEAKGGPRDVRVITMTASSGFITGELCATASYVRFPNQRTLQELYPVLLEGKLADGDCGSGVIDQATGHMYGHIVMGTAGTGQAYIVSAKDVFQDIKEKMGGEVTLIPPGQILEPLPEYDFKLDDLKPWKHKFEYSKRGDPSRVVEFASEEYFRKLKQHLQSNTMEDKTQSIQTPPKSALPQIPPSNVAGPSHRRSTNRPQPLAQKSLSTKRNDDTGSFPQISALKSRSTTANSEAKGKGKENCDVSKQKPKMLAFEGHFFALPSDLQVHVIAYLCVPDILNLRQVSKNWFEFITANETPISRAFLEHNRVPRFAVDLYPLPAPSELNLHHISGLWHRLSVTSKLSTLMADWVTTDIFLRTSEMQQLEFLPQQSRIRRRLIPILFTLSHFFETYRQLHLQHVRENDHPLLSGIISPVERHIMNMYDNETLLQVHQVFPFLLSYLNRKLRPPSYLGRLERSFHGYVRSPLPPPILVGIFCIGGLREVTRISRIESYDSRRAAVDDWYSTVFQQPISYPPEAHRWPLAFGQKKPKQSSPSAAAISSPNQTCNSSPSTSNASKSSKTSISSTRDSSNATLVSPSNHSLVTISDSSDNTRDPKGKGKQKANTNSPSRAAMQPISAEHARVLLQDLPALEQIWIPTAEALLLAKQAVDRWQDIKRNGQAMHELILDEFTAADGLFYGCLEQSFNPDNARRGWGDLLDDDAQYSHLTRSWVEHG